jgi:hypothetical protein
VAAIPRAKDGKDGKSLTPDDVRPIVEELVAAIPRAKDGKDGSSVTMEDISKMLEEKVATWALDFERRAMDLLQRTADKIPLPKDGKDGFGFDDLSVVYDQERTITVRFTKGEQVKEFPIKLSMPLERGVWMVERAYECGDCVTYAGSYWIALTGTVNRPGDNNSDWRLVVKKGRDGKDGKMGERGPPGKGGQFTPAGGGAT